MISLAFMGNSGHQPFRSKPPGSKAPRFQSSNTAMELSKQSFIQP